MTDYEAIRARGEELVLSRNQCKAAAITIGMLLVQNGGKLERAGLEPMWDAIMVEVNALLDAAR